MTKDPYKYFRVEARELLDELGKGALALEKSAHGTESINVVARLLRLAHTLKGAARVVKQHEIADAAHAIEDVLGPACDSGAPATRERIDEILGWIDQIAFHIAELAAAPSAATASLAKQASATPVRDEEAAPIRADVGDMDALLDGIAEVAVHVASLRRRIDAMDQVHRRELAPGIEQTDRELRQVRELAERLRLLPARTLFGSLERTARDASVSLGKKIVFEGTGGDVRLDADMIRGVGRALVQAVRNAVAHGIENESERLAAGKSGAGRIVIQVVRRGRDIAFICADDGRGIDLEAVRGAIEHKGMPASQARALDDDALIELILKGGISTTPSVDALSGRGVGLDVAREVASQLGGRLSLRTVAGQGTTLELVIPLSLAALDALIVEAGGHVAAIPIDGIRSTVRVDGASLIRSADGVSIVVDGDMVPFAPLVRSLRARDGSTDRKAWSAIVVESDGMIAAIGVDRLVRTETIVMRKLPELAVVDPAVAGASIDAEGNPQMVLDVTELVKDARRRADVEGEIEKPSLPILVVDDSLTTRMLMQSILESAGYEVDMATSGEEGLEKARARTYGVMLVDVEMPGMDGFTFVAQSRKDPVLSNVPAILVTSRSSQEDRLRGKNAGARAYIVKSELDQKALLEMIQELAG